MDKLKKLLEYVTSEEDKYYDFAHEAIINGNLQSNLVNMMQATAFQRVRYAIEDLINQE